MEAHIGELQSALSPALSSTNRPKSHIGCEIPKNRTEPRDSALTNQATFYLYNLATSSCRLLHLGSEDDDATQVRIKTLQNSFLRLPARIIISARRAVVILAREAAERLTRLLSCATKARPQLE